MSGSLVLFSGGLDSTAILARVLKNHGVATALHLHYGQVNIREHQASREICSYFTAQGYKINYKMLDISSAFKGSVSELIEGGQESSNWLPGVVRDFKGEAPSSVPFRNGVAIAVAIAQALIEDCSSVWVGITGQGSSQYADCSREFISGMMKAVSFGSGNKVELIAPWSDRTKVQIIHHIMRQENVPVNLTWTCYRSGYKMCGKCLSCVERRMAFHEAGYVDPAEYEVE